MSNLFLDDLRVPSDVKTALHNGVWEEFPSHYTWEIVRSYEEFISFIQKNSLPSMISYDHDLDDSAYMEYHMSKFENRPFDYSRLKEKTGYDCAQFVIDYCKTNGLEFPDYYVHSFNPIGRINIINRIKDYLRTTL